MSGSEERPRDTGQIPSTGHAHEEPLLFERGAPGRIGHALPRLDVPEVDPSALLPAGAIRNDLPGLPELSEVEVVRHFTRLSTWNAAVDLAPYPLGSCTMKYNPKLNERVARLPGFSDAHPLQPDAVAQGLLELFYRLEKQLARRSRLARPRTASPTRGGGSPGLARGTPDLRIPRPAGRLGPGAQPCLLDPGSAMKRMIK